MLSQSSNWIPVGMLWNWTQTAEKDKLYGSLTPLTWRGGEVGEMLFYPQDTIKDTGCLLQND